LGTTPAYQWQWQPAGPSTAWAALSDGINTNTEGTPAFEVSSATSPTVGVRSISGVGGNFRCFVTDTCGSVTSDEATLSVCLIDFNCDGFPNQEDLYGFLTEYFTQVEQPSNCVPG